MEREKSGMKGQVRYVKPLMCSKYGTGWKQTEDVSAREPCACESRKKEAKKWVVEGWSKSCNSKARDLIFKRYFPHYHTRFIVTNNFNIKYFLRVKDHILCELRPWLVYYYKCVDCSANNVEQAFIILNLYFLNNCYFLPQRDPIFKTIFKSFQRSEIIPHNCPMRFHWITLSIGPEHSTRLIMEELYIGKLKPKLNSHNSYKLLNNYHSLHLSQKDFKPIHSI